MPFVTWPQSILHLGQYQIILVVPTPTVVFDSEVRFGYEYRMLELFPAQITFAGIWWDEGAFHGNRVEMETDRVVLGCGWGCSLQERGDGCELCILCKTLLIGQLAAKNSHLYDGLSRQIWQICV